VVGGWIKIRVATIKSQNDQPKPLLVCGDILPDLPCSSEMEETRLINYGGYLIFHRGHIYQGESQGHRKHLLV